MGEFTREFEDSLGPEKRALRVETPQSTKLWGRKA